MQQEQARDEAELETTIRRLARAAGTDRHAVLRTLTEYKKARVSYF